MREQYPGLKMILFHCVLLSTWSLSRAHPSLIVFSMMPMEVCPYTACKFCVETGNQFIRLASNLTYCCIYNPVTLNIKFIQIILATEDCPSSPIEASSRLGIILGILFGVAALFVISMCVGYYVLRTRRTEEVPLLGPNRAESRNDVEQQGADGFSEVDLTSASVGEASSLNSVGVQISEAPEEPKPNLAVQFYNALSGGERRTMRRINTNTTTEIYEMDFK